VGRVGVHTCVLAQVLLSVVLANAPTRHYHAGGLGGRALKVHVHMCAGTHVTRLCLCVGTSALTASCAGCV
jgi:hypothetical protein